MSAGNSAHFGATGGPMDVAAWARLAGDCAFMLALCPEQDAARPASEQWTGADVIDAYVMGAMHALQYAGTQVPPRAWVLEFGAVALPLGHPARLTVRDEFATREAAAAAAQACGFACHVYPVWGEAAPPATGAQG